MGKNQLSEVIQCLREMHQFLSLDTTVVPKGVHRSWRYCNTKSMREVDGASSYSNSLLQESI